MLAFDNWVVGYADKFTCWLQKKGVPLTYVHVWFAAQTLFLFLLEDHIASRSVGSYVLDGVLWGGNLFAYQVWAEKHKNYMEVVSVQKELNARVLYYRSMVAFRSFFYVLGLIIAPVSLAIDGVSRPLNQKMVLLAMAFSLISLSVLNCCTFLGPGEFAKSKQKRFMGNTAADHG